MSLDFDPALSAWSVEELQERLAHFEDLEAAFTDGWRGLAACGPNDVPARWFDPGTEDTRSKVIRQARQVCARCPVKVPCAVEGMVRETGMIHAGTTETMRKVARAKHQSVEWLLAWVRRETVEQVWPPTRAVSKEEWVEVA